MAANLHNCQEMTCSPKIILRNWWVQTPQTLLRAARVQNEFAPEKLLNRYEKRFEKREKGSEKRSETRLENF